MQPEHNAMTEQRTTKPKRQKRAYAGGYSDADKKRIKSEICERISTGDPLRVICREPGMPGWVTVYAWKDDDEEFAERFARARLLGADAIAEEALEIADDGSNDWMEKFGRDGESLGYELNGEHVQRSKLRIETRLKLLAKWFPQKYGERIEQHHTGGMSVTDVPLTEAQRAALDRAIDGDV